MKVCVVGGTGNISTSIVALLLDQGHEVTVFNRGQHSTPPDGVKVIQGDRYDRERRSDPGRRPDADKAGHLHHGPIR